LRRPQELVPTIYQGNLDRAALAAWAPLVLDVADSGDTVAVQIVEEAARELAHTAAALVRTLDFAPRAIPLALSGGVLLASASYRKWVLAALESLGVCADPIIVVHEPAQGALRLARLLQ
jgi:N-acetylglucosamine kinase-like BadF-type ATPase